MVYSDPKKRGDAVPGDIPADEIDDLHRRFNVNLSGVADSLPAKKGAVKYDEWAEYTSKFVTATTGNTQRETGAEGSLEPSQSEASPETYDVVSALSDIEERTRTEARSRASTAEIRQVVGNILIPDHSVVNDSLVVDGKLRVGKGSHIHGSLKAQRGIEIGERVTIDGHVLSEGPILIGKNSKVNGMVDSSDDIMLDENATAEGVFTDKTIMLRPGAKINRKISSGRFGAPAKAQFRAPGEAVFNLPASRTSKYEIPADLDEATAKSSMGASSIRWGVLTHEDQPPSRVNSEEYLSDLFRSAPQLRRGMERRFRRTFAIPFETPELGGEHLFIYAPVRQGKTFLVKNFVIPGLRARRRIITIDSNSEYQFQQYAINYDRTIPDIENDLVKSFVTFKVRTDVDNIVRDAIFRVVTDEDNVSIVLNITDGNCEKMIVSEFLRRLTQVKWSEPVLVVVEDADKYDLVSLVTRGSYSNIQAVFTSWRRLIPDILYNVRLVLGRVRPELIEEYDSDAAEAVAELERYEFLWEKGHHQWIRFKLEAEPEIPSKQPLPVTKPKPEDVMIRRSEGKSTSPIMEPPQATPREQPKTERVAPLSKEEFGKQPGEEGRGKPPEGAVRPEMTKKEAKVVRFKTIGYDDTEIGLRLFMDPVEVGNILLGLKERGLYDSDIKTKDDEKKEI
ncbi:hypothetical protein A3K70_03600 [Candidatus Bathyarchaeota archaeon RBG_16_48_13]|nr:MAG: hypothetical protein A3K70_03600 [Candidatus Bathyarchaeota archaeon RBG_16_48_13]